MAITNAQELLVGMLSNLRHNTDRSVTVYEELGEAAQNPQIKEALEARTLIARQVMVRLEECFRLLGVTPTKSRERLMEIFVEDFRRKLSEIQSPLAKKVFVLAEASRLAQWHIAEYTALIAVADATGHSAVAMLLESCLAEKLVFVKRTRNFIKEQIIQKAAAA